MNNKTKGVIAGIAGLALLGGGTTFALWSDSDTVAGGTITNGDLSVSAGALTWQDVSADRTVSDIDLSTWRMVPGDTARGTAELDVVLVGDNLLADFGVDTTAVVGLPTGVTVTYEVLDEDDNSIGSGALGTDTEVELDASGTYTVVIDVDFDGATVNRVSVDAETVLGNIVVSLDQVR